MLFLKCTCVCLLEYVQSSPLWFWVSEKLGRSRARSWPEKVQVWRLSLAFCLNSAHWYLRPWSPTSVFCSHTWRERYRYCFWYELVDVSIRHKVIRAYSTKIILVGVLPGDETKANMSPMIWRLSSPVLLLAGNLGWTVEICCSAVRACLHSTSSSFFPSFKEMGGDEGGGLTVCMFVYVWRVTGRVSVLWNKSVGIELSLW